MNVRIKNSIPFLYGILGTSLTVIGVLLIFRILFVILFVPTNSLYTHTGDLPHAAYNAFRFDLQVVAYISILPTIITLIQPFITSKRWQQMGKSFCTWYYTIIVILLSLLSAIDLGYYTNFSSHIGITFFDFFDEEPLSLIKTIWDDYPVIWISLGVCLIGFITKITSNWAYQQANNKDQIPFKRTCAIMFIYIVFLIVCLRGSIGRFPLQVEDLIVSVDEHINDIIPNAPYMLKKAMKEKSIVFDIKPTATLLKEYSFKSLQEAMDTFSDKGVKLSNDTLTSLQKVLFSHAGDTLKQQPNVLILCCESWSNYLIHLDPVLQCGIEKHLKEDILFDNFQSVRNGTIATIENITVATPFQRVFRSGYRQYCMPTSIAIPFKNSGYSCEFLSGMDLAWEDCGAALKNQRFDQLTGKFEILKEIPSAEYNSIGVYDEYMLKVILRKLKEKTSKPQMIMAMTTTNHPPLDIPKHAQIPALPEGFCSKPCFNNVGKDVVEKYLRAFQYFNTCLTQFLDEFKKSEAAKNTILILTGDHNVRAILDYNHIGKRWQNSVPLYIYLPPYLRTKDYPVHPKAWGCHYDILATIAPFAFRNTDYPKLGNNLLEKDILSGGLSFSYNEEQVRADKAYLPKAKRISEARELLLRLYFQNVFSKLKF